MSEMLGPYRLLDPLGRGGQGEVWRARAPDGGTVAIKLLRRELIADATVAERFGREARLSMAVRHANVLAALDSGESDGRPWLVSELADGGSLQQRLRDGGPLPLAEALAALLAVLAGLGAIHRAGLVHRDLKPANVLYAGGIAKIADLGLARAVSKDHSCYSTTGALVGTPAFICPEMVLGESVDIRGDLYAAGCLLYTLLCGHSPYGGGTAMEILRRHIEAAVPDPAEGRPGLPDGVRDLVRVLLAKAPGDRPRDPAAALVLAAEAFAACPRRTASAAAAGEDTVSLARPPARQPMPATMPAAGGTFFPPTLAEDAPIPATMPDAGAAVALTVEGAPQGGPVACLRHPAGLLVAWAGSTLRLGRDAPAPDGNHVCLRLPGDALNSRRISGSHLEVRLRGGRAEVRDAGSAGGTRLGERRLPAGEWTALEDGAVIDLAGALLLRARVVPGVGSDAGLLLTRLRDGTGHAYLLVPATVRFVLTPEGVEPGPALTVLAMPQGLHLQPAGGTGVPWGEGIRLALPHGTAAALAWDPALLKL